MWQESGRIATAIERISLSRLAHDDVELVFVDDGSTDDTAVLCERALARFGVGGQVLRLASNQGKGAAVRHGVLAATGDVIGFSDADLSCGPDDIERVFSAVDAVRAPVVIASRTAGASVIAERQPLARRLSGFAFNLELRVLGLTTLHDTQCGLKAFDAAVARTLFEPLRTTRFAFDVEILARCRAAQLPIVEIPVTWRHVEASRVDPLRDGVRMVLDAARIRWTLR
jgi:glycosyltransferase involved in cell wall biosynthesis